MAYRLSRNKTDGIWIQTVSETLNLETRRNFCIYHTYLHYVSNSDLESEEEKHTAFLFTELNH